MYQLAIFFPSSTHTHTLLKQGKFVSLLYGSEHRQFEHVKAEISACALPFQMKLVANTEKCWCLTYMQINYTHATVFVA